MPEDNHNCTQGKRISHIEKALFGDPETKNPGAVKLIEETHATVKEMKPAYKLVRDAGVFAEVGKKVGNWIIFIIIFFSSLFGAIYAIKEWIKK